MKNLALTKFIAFIIAVMMFSALPGLVNAQTHCVNGHCPPGKVCINGTCVSILIFCNCQHRPIPFACGQRCGWFTDPTTEREGLSISFNTSETISFQLDEIQNVSAKVYDTTGKLVKVLANAEMQAGIHQFEWDARDEKGYAVPAGIYMLQMNDDTQNETQKISVIN